MDKVPADIAKKLLNKDFTNLVARVQRGGKLSVKERAMLQSMAVGTAKEQATATSYVELADILGVTRQALYKWAKREGSPKASSNGTHDVVAWRAFMSAQGLSGKQQQDQTDMEAQLRARKLLAEVEERELRLAVKREEYVPVDAVKTTWMEQIGRATAMLRRKFEQELPPVIAGQDPVTIQKEARKAIDEVMKILHETDGN